MADIIHTLIEFTERDRFNDFVKAYISLGHDDNEGDYEYFDFEKVVPMPKSKQEAPDYFFDSRFYKYKNTRYDMTGRLAGDGYPEGFDWWNWCIEHWGTKWNSCGTTIDKENLMIYFESAWCLPAPIFEVIADSNPLLWNDMRIVSICEFNGFNRMDLTGGRYNPKDYANAEPSSYKKGSNTTRDVHIPITTINTNESMFEYYEDFEKAFPDAVKVLKLFDEDIDLPRKDLPFPPKENKWKIGETTLKLHTPIWDVMETEKTNPEGKVGKFVSLKTPDWVKAIIYNTSTKKFVITREFRQGINDYDIAFPSGTVEPGEDPMDAVKREVTEETGFKNITECKLLGAFPPNVAFMNNTMYIYYIEVDGEKTNRNLDEFEDIDMLEVNKPMDFGIRGQTDTLGWYLYKDLISEE